MNDKVAMKNHEELVQEHLRKYSILLQPISSQRQGQLELQREWIAEGSSDIYFLPKSHWLPTTRGAGWILNHPLLVVGILYDAWRARGGSLDNWTQKPRIKMNWMLTQSSTKMLASNTQSPPLWGGRDWVCDRVFQFGMKNQERNSSAAKRSFHFPRSLEHVHLF